MPIITSTITVLLSSKPNSQGATMSRSKELLFDHLVRLGGLKVDVQLEFGCLLDKSAGFSPLRTRPV
jgi:hypothetical protein